MQMKASLAHTIKFSLVLMGIILIPIASFTGGTHDVPSKTNVETTSITSSYTYDKINSNRVTAHSDKSFLNCNFADVCEEVTEIIAIPEIDQGCVSIMDPIFIIGCLDGANPEDFGVCGMDQLPTVWFHVTVANTVGVLLTSIESGGSWNPIWSIWTGGCDSLQLVRGVHEKGLLGISCSIEDDNPDILAIPIEDGYNDYWIAVSADGMVDNPNFVLGIQQGA